MSERDTIQIEVPSDDTMRQVATKAQFSHSSEVGEIRLKGAWFWLALVIVLAVVVK